MPSRSAVGRGAVLLAAALCIGARAAHSQETPGPEPGPTRPRPQVTSGPSSRPTRHMPARAHMLSRPQITNVIDEALYVLAEHYVAAGRVPDAVEVLNDMAAATPDAETRSCAHLNLGVICQEKLGDQAQARVHFSKVMGRNAATARNRILAPLRRKREWAESVKFLTECLENATEAEDRAAVVKQLIYTVRSSGDNELMESVLSSVPGMITYEDAEKEAESRRSRLDEARKAKLEEARRARAARPPVVSPGRFGGPKSGRARGTEPRGRAAISEPKDRWGRRRPRTSREPPPPVGRGRAVDDEAADEEAGDDEPAPQGL